MLTVMPGPANRGAGRPKRPTAWDYRHEDSKEGRFFVFDDRLQLSKDDKYHIENSIDHHVIDAGETPVTFAAAAGPSGDVYLTAIRKTSVKRDFVLIRKATRAEVDAMFGIVRRRRKSDTRRDIRRRLAEVERALDRLPPSPGIGHNQMPLDSALHREGIEAVRGLAEEIQAERPSPAKITQKVGVLRRVSDALAVYASSFRDGVLKETGVLVAAAYAPKLLPYAEQALAKIRVTLEAITQWIATLPPGGPMT